MTTQEPAGSAGTWLPAPDAPVAAFAELADDLDRHTTEELIALSFEVGRRRTSGQVTEAQQSALSALEQQLHGLIGRRRLEEERSRIADAERRKPLRLKIHKELSRQDSRPAHLAELFKTSREMVSRALAQLASDHLVEFEDDPTDGRRRIYRLTEAGHLTLNRHLALGKRETPRSPSRDSTLILLNRAIDMAVEIRRRENRVDDALSRLRQVVAEAEKLQEPDLIIRARRELLTTLRQARQTQEFAQQIDELKKVVAGERAELGPEWVLPAFAHQLYELGRICDITPAPDPDAAKLLLSSAQETFSSLPVASRYEDWREREAWALASLASFYRQRGDIPEAFAATQAARRLFEEIGDAYGLSRCAFLDGFCHRLLGNFQIATTSLKEAHRIADEEGFKRFQADSLLQIGEVERCLGSLNEAGETLREALERASQLNMGISLAFAYSALGATAFMAGDESGALDELDKAKKQFSTAGHAEGKALTLRRLAVVCRVARPEGVGRIHKLLSEAARSYFRFRSPAGVAACQIDQGRFALEQGESAHGPTQWLTKVSELTDCRMLLERDPWIPQMLLTFAEEVDDGDLEARAKQLRDAAARRDEQTHMDLGIANESAFEMAAEPLRSTNPELELPALP